MHRTSISLADHSLDLMGLSMIGGAEQPPSPLPLVEEQFRVLDTDKVLHTLIISDHFANYDPAHPFDEGSFPTGMAIDARLREGVQYAAKLGVPPANVLGIVVMSGIARFASLGLNGGAPRQMVLPLQMRELVCLSYLEQQNPLYLWHFANARQQLCETTELMSFGLADELVLYRSKDSSFYMSDDRAPNLLVVQPNEGGSLLLEALRKFDPHAIDTGRRSFQECVRVHPGTSLPAYCPRFPSPDEPSQCVEIGGGVIWVRADIRPLRPFGLPRQIAIALVDACALWISRMQDCGFVQSAARRELSVHIQLADPEHWRYPETEPQEVPFDLGITCEQLEAGVILATFPADCMTLIAGTSGTEERMLLAPVFRAMAAACDATAAQADAELARVLHSPRHRKLVPISSHETAAALLRELPPKHLVPAAAEQQVLNDIGKALARQGLHAGPIPRERRVPTLNGVVAALFEMLKKDIESLDSGPLLKWLIAHNEALIDQIALARRLEPFNVACYGPDAGPAVDFANRLTSMYKADQASRFLIEYVAACPPRGSDAMSYSRYDRLLAIATKMIHFGMVSDDIHYACDDPSLAVLPSGRLGVGESRRHAMRDQYLAAVGGGLRARLSRGSRAPAPKWFAEEEKQARETVFSASADEFGFSLDQFAELALVCIKLAQQERRAVTSIAISDLASAFAEACRVDQAVATEWLMGLSLVARGDFLAVPKPAIKSDVYPWRYNRLWSYLRRPFVLRDNQLLFGTSHVARATANLLHLCTSGRLKARSSSMLEAMGRVTKLNGFRFNELVADLFKDRSDLVVRSRIESFDGERAASPQGTLGDIDVLAADPRRKRLRAYECKDLSVARVPSEIHNELKGMVDGDKSIVAKHQRRVDWLKKNLGAVLRELGLSDKGRWDVKGVIVVDEELVSPFLVDIPMQVMTIAALEAELAAGKSIP